MTLILVLGNQDQIVQISDRRLTQRHANGIYETQNEEYNKATLLWTADARMVVGFSGLATNNGFSTQRWLVDALYDCGQPEYLSSHIINRFCERARYAFATIPQITSLPRQDRSLTVVFSGHLLTAQPPLAVYALVSNCLNPEGTALLDQVQDSFAIRFWTEHRPAQNAMTLIVKIGAYRALQSADEARLRAILSERKPADAIVGIGIEMFRQIADRQAAAGTIGKQLTVGIAPSDPTLPIETRYYSDVNSYKSYTPDYVYLISKEKQEAFRDMVLEPVDPAATGPIHVAKVGRNAPCPCGSGKKYKRCHGRKLPKLGRPLSPASD